jgi:Flp pilus assembly protein TadG
MNDVVADERGSIAITGLLLAFALVLLIGTGVDIARAFIVRRDLTAIADSAALSGSQQLDLERWREGGLSLDPQQAEETADDELDAYPGIAGSSTASPGSITVRAEERFPTFILRLVGIPELTVSATATATPEKP